MGSFKRRFLKENNVVNTLKLRGGYGIVGNDQVADFRYISLVSGGYNYSFGNTGAITTGYANVTLDNPDLKWEETSQASIGLDARLFNDFTVTLDFYKKKTTGILRPVVIPGYVGVAEQPWANVADMNNSGVEFELSWKKKLGDFNLGVNGNVAYLKMKLLT